jgi:hypothetical protein
MDTGQQFTVAGDGSACSTKLFLPPEQLHDALSECPLGLEAVVRTGLLCEV